MSKAMLVVDMPKNCEGCDFSFCLVNQAGEYVSRFCGAPGRGERIEANTTGKPNFCPLKPVVAAAAIGGGDIRIATGKDVVHKTEGKRK